MGHLIDMTFYRQDISQINKFIEIEVRKSGSSQKWKFIEKENNKKRGLQKKIWNTDTPTW